MLGALSVGRMLVSTRHLVQPQTAVVDGDLRDRGAADPEALPAPASDVCHGPGRDAMHHLAERFGSEMELLVATWTMGLEHDPRARAVAFGQLHEGVNAACLLSVGLRRHVRTLRRIGYRVDAPASIFQEYWADLLEARSPQGPRSDTKPLPGCVLCPDPCSARAVVESSTLLSLRRARRDLDRAPGSQRIVDLLRTIDDEIAAELGQVRKLPAIAACARAHLAREFGVEARLLDELG